MKKNEVKVGGLYHAKVSDKLVTVRIDSTHTHGGWHATNTATGKRIRIKSAQRLRGPARADASTGTTKTQDPTKNAKTETGRDTGERGATGGQPKADGKPDKVEARHGNPKASNTTTSQKPKLVSALDAAAQVLKSVGKPMRAKEMIAAMAEQNLWKSPGGATPHATLYAAMMREARDKGDASRFRKVDRGMFAFNKAGA